MNNLYENRLTLKVKNNVTLSFNHKLWLCIIT